MCCNTMWTNLYLHKTLHFPPLIHRGIEGIKKVERDMPISKIWQYPQQMRVARFTSTQQQSCLSQHSTLNGKVHLSFSNQPSYFLPQPAISKSSMASHSSFDLQPHFTSQDVNILYFQHMTIPTNTVCHSQLISSFLQTQNEHEIHRSFSVFVLHSKHSSNHGSFCP